MSVHSMSHATKTDRSLRLVMWSGLLALVLVILLGLTADPGTPPRRVAAIAAAVLTAGLAVFAFFAAMIGGASKYRESLSIELLEDRIIRRHDGEPQVTVLFSEVASVAENSGGLEVRGSSNVVFIPVGISGFLELRDRLAHIRKITRVGFSILALVSPAVLVVSWILFMASHLRHVVLLAACGIVVFQIWETIWLLNRVRRGRTRLPILVLLAFNWLAAIGVMYWRLGRLS
jgi:hypothetical protein